MLRFFLDDCKLSITAAAHDGTTALHAAAETGQLAVVRVLVNDYKADFNLKRKVGAFLVVSAITCHMLVQLIRMA